MNSNKSYDSIKMILKKKPEYVSIIRITVSSIANKMGFNIEEIDDIKLALGETCTSLIKKSTDNESEYNIEFIIKEDSLSIIIEDLNNSYDIENCRGDKKDLSFFIINTLMDEVVCNKNGKSIKVLLVKNRSRL
ncbi:ATP-binding protein [Abyssisolibacter fermentans]|uniref:ATP-binding protein n=1 Tax=Abyssisolibacter fermentans TaxID=1766203 RepID=UPI0008379133|nr:ATP-binding protein [Abyssisolibacter fermentans]